MRGSRVDPPETLAQPPLSRFDVPVVEQGTNEGAGSADYKFAASVAAFGMLLRNSEFKRRQLPFSLKVSPWAFGRGRRIPLTGL